MFATAKSRLIRYFFFGNSITNDGYLRLAYLLGRFLVFLPLSLCATLVLGIYSLFRPVKIFMLRCERSKISFIVEDLEVALRIEAHKEKTTGVRRPFMFAVLDCESPNRAFTSMYGRVVPFLDADRPFSRGVIRYALPIFRLHRQYLARRQSTNQMAIWSETPPTLKFTDDERKRGTEIRKNLAPDPTKPFVCIALPEKSYYEVKFRKEHPASSSTDLYSQIPSWKTYFGCIKYLSDVGIEVIRMGQIVDSEFPTDNCGIIDYAVRSRSELGDIWLLANCKFVIAGAGTGLYWPSSAFNRPSLLTDSYALFNTSYGQQDIKTPQLAWSRSEKKLLSFSWMMEQGEGWGLKKSLIDGDIELIKNTAEEITEVVLEMNQRIDGTWIETDEDIELQERFRELRKVVPQWQVQQSVRIGAAFLRRYKHLL